MKMPDWLIPILTVIAGILGPLLTMQVILHRANRDKLNSIDARVGDIDDRLRSVQVLVAQAADHAFRITRLEDRLFVARDAT